MTGSLCLGDLVGYGADPNQVAQWAKSNVASVVRGNHDRACTGTDLLGTLQSIRAGLGVLDPWRAHPGQLELPGTPARGPLRVTPDGVPDGGFDLVHGSPLDEDEYLVGVEDVRFLADYLDTKLTFFGHTHLQGGFLLGARGVKRFTPCADGRLQLDRTTTT